MKFTFSRTPALPLGVPERALQLPLFEDIECPILFPRQDQNCEGEDLFSVPVLKVNARYTITMIVESFGP